MIELHAVDPQSAAPHRYELPLERPARCRLRCLPGAEAIQVVLSDAEKVLLRAEVPAEGGEVVAVTVEPDNQGRPALICPERKVLTLAAEAQCHPVPISQPAAQGAPLDLALVVDATLRASGGLLLADHEAWAPLAEQLVRLAAALVEGRPEPRLALLAFGDEAPPEARAEDLLPRYRLFPAPSERRFRGFDGEVLRCALGAIPPTSGGDFVDALADALAACAELHWRPEARRLLLLVGDSPGYSIVRPAPEGADAGIRERDVEGVAIDLHERGIEIATLYRPPPGEALAGEQELLDFVRDQYRRLASCPELAFATPDLEPIAMAEQIHARRGPFARMASLGELVAIDVGDTA